VLIGGLISALPPSPPGDHHSRHGSQPHHAGVLQEVHPGVAHPPRKGPAAPQIHLADRGQVHQGMLLVFIFECIYEKKMKMTLKSYIL